LHGNWDEAAAVLADDPRQQHELFNRNIFRASRRIKSGRLNQPWRVGAERT
jgi:hypothetical protein